MEQSECVAGKERIQKVLKLAESYDISDVMQRYKEKTRLPDDVLKEHEREIKRFLALSSINPGSYGMRGPLDELWHTFIIFTSSYARFCKTLGGNFIHHLPEVPRPSEIAKPQAPKGSYIKFLKDYQELIGEEAPVDLWPRPGGDSMSPSCNNCGIHCSETCAALIGEEIQRYKI